MKVRAKFKKDITEVKLLAEHPMDTGRVKNSKGAIIPAHYITELTATYKDKVVFTALLGPAVSKDPYLKFQFKGAAKGDSVVLKWVDNKDQTKEVKAEIK